MPVQTCAVATPLEPITYLASRRRLLAYASSIYATKSLEDEVKTFSGLPQFCVTPEWQLSINSRSQNLGLTAAESRLAVHAAQDSVFHRLVAPEESLSTSGTVVSVSASRAGAIVSSIYETKCLETGEPIATTTIRVIFRGVAITGTPQPESDSPGPPPIVSIERDCSVEVPLDRGFAHRYSECADIWNPIHTERSVALAAGLPDIIVHGTAIWALAGQEIIRRYAANDPTRLRRLSGRFSAMVLAGDPISVEMGCDGSQVTFVVRNAQGQEAISQGYALIG